MQHGVRNLAIAAVFALFPAVTMSAAADRFAHDDAHPGQGPHVQLGPRPFYLVDKMEPSRLKRDLQKCTERPFFYQTDFSIGHRGGGALQFPEHTKESHEAGARMGAGVLECDVTFTSDGELVCRHDQCDLHTTTNILVTDRLPASARCPSRQPNSMPPARPSKQPRRCAVPVTLRLNSSSPSRARWTLPILTPRHPRSSRVAR